MVRGVAEQFTNYQNTWVAFTPDRKKVVAFDSDPKKLVSKLRKLKIKKGDAILHFVLPSDRQYSFNASPD